MEGCQRVVMPVTDPLSKNKLPVFHPAVKETTKGKLQLQSMKSECNLFSQLYLSCHATDGDMDQLFSHENNACSPSLTLGGKRSLSSKVDVLPCIEVKTAASETSPLVDATFLDGAVVVQMLNPGIAKTFLDYVEQVFLS